MSTCSRLRALLSSTILAAVHPAGCASLLALAALAAAPAQAQVNNWTGAVSTNWFDAGNWTNGVPDGDNITGIETVSPNPTVVSGGAARTDSLFVGAGTGTSGTLTITNGGTLTTETDTHIGSFGTGNVTVKGVGARWTTETLHVGNAQGGRGTLTIGNGGTVSGGTFATVGNLTWQPLAETPMHPEYPCAHCIAAASTGAVLEAIMDSATIPEVAIGSPTAPGVTHRFTDLRAFVREVSEARIRAGFHYRFSTRVAEDMGRKIAEHVVQNLMQPTKSADVR